MTISKRIRHTVYASQVWYHGSPTARMTFEDQVWDRKRGERDLNENGPGLYFTDSAKEAKAYGQYLFEAQMKPGFKLMPNKKPTLNILLSIFNKASEEDQEIFLSNWGENIKPKEALANYLKPTIHDSAVALYGDLVRSPADWVKIMVAVGYEGIVIDRRESKHLLVWNPSKMNITSSDLKTAKLVEAKPLETRLLNLIDKAKSTNKALSFEPSRGVFEEFESKYRRIDILTSGKIQLFDKAGNSQTFSLSELVNEY